MSRFDNIVFGLEFRKYQQDMLDYFDTIRSKGDRRFHFLAPPGAGKTLLGLEMVRRIGEKAVVFSPNSAIQMQWKHKLLELTDEMSISTTPSDTKDILSLTYQSITVKDKNTGELHENARDLIALLKDRKTIVLDECHHLTAWWADVVKDLIEHDCFVIGLTATPPIHREQRAVNNYLTILEDIDYQIPLPSVIKEGFLAPFQDLVYITEPTEEEKERLHQSGKEFNALIAELNEPEGDTVPLKHWCWQRLEEYRNERGTIVAFDELFLEKPDLCIAYARYVKETFQDLPLSVILYDEMDEPAQLSDMTEILEDYCNTYLLKQPGGKKTAGKIKTTISRANSTAALLGLSKNKMAAMKTIISREMEYMADDFRGLILTDYETGKHDDGTSAVEVMKTLTSDPVTDLCNPVLLTGSTVLVDDDLKPLFDMHAQDYFKEEGLDVPLEYVSVEGFYEIKGTGKHWNTKTWVRLITRLFEEGTTKCLVGTRGLLGEGWDSIKLNTLIDLTLVSSFVSVNQVRGRSIRFDYDNPLKTANNWDIITLAEDLQRGFLDLERFKKKHAQFFGMSDDGIIEKGIGHVHPSLTNAEGAQLFLQREEINALMLERAGERLENHKRWKVGEPYKDKESISMEFIPMKEAPQIQLSARKGEFSKEIALIVKKKTRQSGQNFALGSAIIFLFLFFLVNMPAFSALLMAAGFSFLFAFIPNGVSISKVLSKAKEYIEESNSLEENIRALAQVVFYGMQDIGLLEKTTREDDIVITRRDDGSYRVLLEGDENSKLFTKSLGELMGPIQNGRYMIEKKELVAPDSFFKWLKGSMEYKNRVFHPIPEIFGKKRQHAEIFKKHWNRLISPGDIYYTRRGDGKKLLKANFRKRTLPLHQKKKEIWI